MRNGRVGENTLYVVLPQCKEIAGAHGSDCNDRQQKENCMRLLSPGQQIAEQQPYNSGLGCGRDKRGYRRRGALIYVGGPKVEGNHAEFESDTGDAERYTREQKREVGPIKR